MGQVVELGTGAGAGTRSWIGNRGCCDCPLVSVPVHPGVIVVWRPEPGDVLRVGGRASAQFGGDRALVLRVTSVCKKPTYDGWAWVTGYVLNRAGEAVERRELFVLVEGLRLLPTRTANRSARGRRV